MNHTELLRLPPASEVRETVRQARKGDADALGALLGLFRPYLFLTANKHLHRLVKPKMGESDLVQQTLMEAQVGFCKFVDSERTNVRRWLQTLLMNNIADAHDRFLAADKRKVSRERQLEGSGAWTALRENLRARGESPSNAFAKVEARNRVHHALARLNPDHRQVIELRDFQRLDYATIAQQPGRSEKAVRMLHLRALARLTSLFEGDAP